VKTMLGCQDAKMPHKMLHIICSISPSGVYIILTKPAHSKCHQGTEEEKKKRPTMTTSLEQRLTAP